MARRLLGAAGLFLVAGAVAVGAHRAPDLLSRMEIFRVERVVVTGLHYLEEDEVVAAAALAPGTNLWDDPSTVEARIRSHPLVLDARVRRRLPRTLAVEVTERRPVALVPTPTLVPVDGQGRVLPLDPSVHRMDLPLLRVDGDGGAGSTGDAIPSRRARLLAEEVARLAELDPAFVGRVSELAWLATGEVMAWWGDPAIQLRFRPPLSSRRIREAAAVVADAAARHPDRRIAGVDLHYADQVVVRYGKETD